MASCAAGAQEILLAIDIGSSSIRCSAYTYDRCSNLSSVLATFSYSRRNVEPNTGKIILESCRDDRDGMLEVLPLLDAIDKTVDEVLLQLRSRQQEWKVVGIGFASFVMNLVGLDENNEVVGTEATISYACSSQNISEQVQALKGELGEERTKKLYELTGAPLHSAYAVPQLREFYQSNKETSDSIVRWQTLASLCLLRWTGARKKLPISYSEASWLGLLNYSTCQYEELALELLSSACRDALPDLADFNQVDDSLKISASNPYGVRWPETLHARLFLGVGDGACANIGSKCTTPTRIACTVGTSAAARICLPCRAQAVSNDIMIKPGLFCYRVDRSHLLVGGALTDGGSVIEWIKQLLNLNSDDAFENCMKLVSELIENDDSNGVDEDYGSNSTPITVPFLSGERSVGFRTGAKGAIFGLTRDTTPAHLVKSCLEGVTHRLTAVIQLIVKAASSATMNSSEMPPQIIVSGRALEANRLWRQMIADSCGLHVILDNETTEGTSRGVACLMAYAIEMSRSSTENSASHLKEEQIHSAFISTPRMDRIAYWRKKLTAQEELIDALSPLYTIGKKK